jgi:hypothetical protein
MVLGRAAGGVLVYRNDGSANEPTFVPVDAESASGFVADVLALPLPAYSAPVFVDLDGDGDRDVLTGGQGGGLMYWEWR